MPRTYELIIPPVAAAGAKDLLQIASATGKVVRLKRVRINSIDSPAATSQMLQWRMSLLTGTTAAGTGGTSVTPNKVDPGDATNTFTANANNTGKATGTVASPFYNGSDHVFNGLDETFDGVVMKAPPLLQTATTSYIVVELLATQAISGTVTLGGMAEVEEEG